MIASLVNRERIKGSGTWRGKKDDARSFSKAQSAQCKVVCAEEETELSRSPRDLEPESEWRQKHRTTAKGSVKQEVWSAIESVMSCTDLPLEQWREKWSQIAQDRKLWKLLTKRACEKSTKRMMRTSERRSSWQRMFQVISARASARGAACTL